jgi:diacylglycerol kinase (ATP)
MSTVPPVARGVSRIWHAGGYSLAGLQTAWDEAAFRQEALVAAVLLPASFILGQTWMETAMLAGSVMLVLIVELLNSAVEAAIDRIGPEWHELSRQAKDLGSAAVLLSLLFCGAVWAGALIHRFV